MSRKPKVTVEELFLAFYDSQVFNVAMDGDDISSRLTREAISFIAEADHTFKIVDASRFKRELMALRIELFNLAWFTYNYELSEVNQNVEDKDLLKGMVFTKSYLVKSGGKDIWDIMGTYNSVITKAKNDRSLFSWSGIDKSLFPGFPRVEVSFPDEQSRRKFWLEEEGEMRQHWSQKFAKFIKDPDCANRCANLFTSCETWKDGVISQKLATEFVDRLGFDQTLNCEAIFRLQRIVVGLYNGARDFIEIKPFTTEYIESLRNFVIGLEKAVKNLESNKSSSGT